MENRDKPAYPVTEETTDRIDAGIAIYTGLTKREYFAAMAMQGMLGQSGIHHKTMMQISSDAVRMADHLLDQLEKEDK